MPTLSPLTAAISVIAFYVGYVYLDDIALVVLARNTFGVALVLTILFWALPHDPRSKKNDVRTGFAFSVIAVLMGVCWALSQTSLAPMMPEWLTIPWAQLVSGGIGVTGMLIFWFPRPREEKAV